MRNRTRGHCRAAKSLLLAILLSASTGVARAQPVSTAGIAAQELVSKVEAYMDAAVRVNGFSGAILVARDGSPVIARGYGAANLELDVPNTPETVFKVGSIAKSFTAVAILQLQDDGKLTVRDSICKHLRDCPDAWKPVTIHHLLTHTAGIPSFTELPDYPRTMAQPVTHPEMVARFRNRPLEFAPGAQASYNNSAFYLAGMIIENVSGKSYDRFLQERIFTPSGMTRSGYDRSRDIVKGRAAGYELVDGKLMNAKYIDMSVPFASGSIYSTVHDLLRFDQALYTDKLLTKASRDQMFTVHAQSRGYGWTVRRRFGRLNIGKDGAMRGFTADLSRFPEDRATVIVLGNSDAAVASKLSTDLSAIMFAAPYELPAPRVAITLSPEALRRYTGSYKLASGHALTLTLENGKLIRQGEDGSRRELVPESVSRFFVRDRDITFTFRFNAKRNVTGFVITNGDRETSAERVH